MNILAAILYFKMAAMKCNVLDIFITSVAIGRLYIYIYTLYDIIVLGFMYYAWDGSDSIIVLGIVYYARDGS